jgi:hypothetical protein
MAKLIKAVFVKDPDRNRTVLLQPGEEPEPRLAALVTNPDAWEDGKLTEAAQQTAAADTDGDSGEQDKAKDSDSGHAHKGRPGGQEDGRQERGVKPARGRDAAGEGDSGD